MVGLVAKRLLEKTSFVNSDHSSYLPLKHHETSGQEIHKKLFALRCTYYAVHIAKLQTTVTGIYTHIFTVDIVLMLNLCTPLPWQPQSVQAVGVNQSR